MKCVQVLVAIFFCSMLQVFSSEDQEWKARLELKVELLAHQMQMLIEKESFTTREKETDFQNSTIEERVSVLEFQVTSLTDDVTELGADLTLVEGEQLIQNEKIFGLELDTEGLDSSVDALVAENVNLNVRLGNVNNSVNTLDGRVGQLELSGAIAFQVEIGDYGSIPFDSIVLFSQIFLNLGGGFNEQTGEFTVPPGGAGLYYFHISFLTLTQKQAVFLLRVNGANVCRAWGQAENQAAEIRANPSCGAVVDLNEGDLVYVFYTDGTDDLPVSNNDGEDNIFSGFRIAPQ